MTAHSVLNVRAAPEWGNLELYNYYERNGLGYWTVHMQPPASLCRPTIVKYEPPAFSLEQPTQMFMRDERNQVLQNHVAAANAVFNKVAVFERLIQQEPHNAMYNEGVQHVQKNQHIHVAIKLQHILETDDKF